MRVVKNILTGVGALGFVMIILGAGAADCGADEKIWMSVAIVGALFIVLTRLIYSYLNWMQEERARKSIRYRRYLEMQNKMSA